MRLHLQTGAAIRSYKDLREKIEAFLIAKGVWNFGYGGVSSTRMEVGAMWKGGGKSRGKSF